MLQFINEFSSLTFHFFLNLVSYIMAQLWHNNVFVPESYFIGFNGKIYSQQPYFSLSLSVLYKIYQIIRKIPFGQFSMTVGAVCKIVDLLL